jgi:hypothetical protein
MSTPIFNALLAAEQGRDAGMRQAEEHADSRVILAIDAAIERAIDSGRPFTVNDIRAEFPTISSCGLVGSRFRSAALRKPARMVQTGRWVKSDLPSTRAARVAEWRGVAEGQQVAS